jgi:hypothetical protein
MTKPRTTETMTTPVSKLQAILGAPSLKQLLDWCEEHCESVHVTPPRVTRVS